MGLEQLLPSQVREKMGFPNPGYSTENSQLKVENSDLNVDIMDAKDFKTEVDVVTGLETTRLDSKEFIVEPLKVLGTALLHVPVRVSQQPVRGIFNASSRLENGPSDPASNKYPKLSVVGAGSIAVVGYAFSARKVDATMAQSDLKFTFEDSTFEYALNGKEGKGFIWNHALDQTLEFAAGAFVGTDAAGVGVKATSTFGETASDSQGRYFFDPLSTRSFEIIGTNVAVTLYPIYLTKSVRSAIWDYIVADKLHELPGAIVADLFRN